MLVGITGNIGSGKSTVSKFLLDSGYRVFNADEVGKKVLLKGEKGYRAVVEQFGRLVLKGNGEIDTKKLAAIVFSDRRKLNLLTSITHPLILKEIELIKKNCESQIAFVEAAVLIEYGWQYMFDYIITVFAYRGQRLLRASRRLGLREAIRRDSFQLSYREKLKYSDFLICNTKDMLNLKNQVLMLMQHVKELQRCK